MIVGDDEAVGRNDHSGAERVLDALARTAAGYVPIVSEYDQRVLHGGRLLPKLRTAYSERVVDEVKRQLLAYGEVRRGTLGLDSEDLSPRYAEQLGVPAGQREQVFKMFGRLHPADAYPGEYVRDIAAQIKERHGARYRDLSLAEQGQAFAPMAIDWVIADAQRVTAKFGIRYDTWFKQSSFIESGYLAETIEELRRRGVIAERDGVTDGLVCVLTAVEPCQALSVGPNRAARRLEVRAELRKCLHVYFYLIDRELGWLNLRLQTWFPFTVQVVINGREWLVLGVFAVGQTLESFVLTPWLVGDRIGLHPVAVIFAIMAGGQEAAHDPAAHDAEPDEADCRHHRRLLPRCTMSRSTRETCSCMRWRASSGRRAAIASTMRR